MSSILVERLRDVPPELFREEFQRELVLAREEGRLPDFENVFPDTIQLPASLKGSPPIPGTYLISKQRLLLDLIYRA